MLWNPDISIKVYPKRELVKDSMERLARYLMQNQINTLKTIMYLMKILNWTCFNSTNEQFFFKYFWNIAVFLEILALSSDQLDDASVKGLRSARVKAVFYPHKPIDRHFAHNLLSDFPLNSSNHFLSRRVLNETSIYKEWNYL